MQDATRTRSLPRRGHRVSRPVMPWTMWAADPDGSTRTGRTSEEPPDDSAREARDETPNVAHGSAGASRGDIEDGHEAAPVGQATSPDDAGGEEDTGTPPATEPDSGPSTSDPIEVLSHELRSPITTIHLGTKVLRSRRNVKDPVKRAVVEAVEIEAERLYRLVEDLLAVARHEGGREPLPVQPILLQRTVPALLETEAATHEGTPIRAFLPESLPPVIADEAGLGHVLRNVVGNAVRFAPPGSPVEVTAEERDGMVELRIADTGPGIDPEEAERLFEPFYRSRRRSGTPGGAGLGLAAARRLLSAMGGTIGAAPRTGGGAVVTLRLESARDAGTER